MSHDVFSQTVKFWLISIVVDSLVMVRHRILIVKEMQFCIDPFFIAQKINCCGGSHRIQDFGLTSSAARYFLIAFWSLTCCFGALIATQSLFYVIAASACCWKCDILIPSLSVYFFFEYGSLYRISSAWTTAVMADFAVWPYLNFFASDFLI